jgi:hypothetical protein
MKRVGIFAIAALAAAVCSTSALGQQASWTLFGSPSEGAQAVTPEQTFVHPVTAPYFHEDSFVSTDVRAWFVYHRVPDSVLGGGDAKVYAAQVRVALTNRLQLVAYKDGYTDLDTGALKDDGWNDVGAGLKWNFLQDYDHQFFLAIGAGYEFPVGDPSVLQNNGDTRLWVSANKGFGRLHLGATFNTFFANDTSRGKLGESNTLSYHLHADYFVTDWFSPVLEFNGFHTWDKGNQALPFSGADVTTFGGGDDVAWVGLGAEIRPLDRVAFRAAYEIPVTNGTDLFDWRVTVSAVYSF